MRLLRLSARMLRYRVAAMIWLFMLVGAAHRGGLERFSWDYAWASLALAAGYVAATSLNDVADEAIDRINHPRDSGRPLVTGEASAADLRRLNLLAGAVALVTGAALGSAGLALVALSLAVSWAYSAAPLRLSYRTYLTAPALGAAYVLIPYGLGILAAGASVGRGDATLAGALFSLFVARIVLKDFRDREGDARYGKPTLLLHHGKTATCLVSAGALLVGNVLLLTALRPPLVLGVLLELFVLAVGWMLRTLWRSRDARLEQVAIGIGARMGNGLLLAVLGWLVLSARAAAVEEQLGFAAMLAALFGLSFAVLVSHPDEAVIGYKG